MGGGGKAQAVPAIEPPPEFFPATHPSSAFKEERWGELQQAAPGAVEGVNFVPLRLGVHGYWPLSTSPRSATADKVQSKLRSNREAGPNDYQSTTFQARLQGIEKGNALSWSFSLCYCGLGWACSIFLHVQLLGKQPALDSVC